MKQIISPLFFFIFIFNLIYPDDKWEEYKNSTCLEMKNIAGWCSEEKARLIMDVIRNESLKECIEIGVFSGMSLFPIARTLQFLGHGKVFGIDPWDPLESIKGFSDNNPNYLWWKELDHDYYYQETLKIIENHHLKDFCIIIKNTAQNLSFLFQDESIDFIHFDGNHNEKFAYDDVIRYFPKLRDGGYILLNDPIWMTLRKSLVFLLERTEIVSPFHRNINFLLLKKNNSRLEKITKLMNHE